MLDRGDLDKRSAMEPLDLALSSLLGEIDTRGEHLRIQGRIAQGFAAIAGQTVREHVKAVWFDKGVVTVVTDSGIWAQELAFLAEEYREKLNVSLGGDIVTAVTFRTRSVR
jgi:predicted nucleic acid-binding Zn ribbon protein